MKPSPQCQGFIYENQTPSAISDQKQQPSGQGYQGRTGKAINCQSLHRSTSQSTTTTPLYRHPPLPTDTHTYSSSTFTVQYSDTYTCTYPCINRYLFVHQHYMMVNIWSSLSLSRLNRFYLFKLSRV